ALATLLVLGAGIQWLRHLLGGAGGWRAILPHVDRVPVAGTAGSGDCGGVGEEQRPSRTDAGRPRPFQEIATGDIARLQGIVQPPDRGRRHRHLLFLLSCPCVTHERIESECVRLTLRRIDEDAKPLSTSGMIFRDWSGFYMMHGISTRNIGTRICIIPGLGKRLAGHERTGNTKRADTGYPHPPESRLR